jgi:hypothetical protein
MSSSSRQLLHAAEGPVPYEMEGPSSVHVPPPIGEEFDQDAQSLLRQRRRAMCKSMADGDAEISEERNRRGTDTNEGKQSPDSAEKEISMVSRTGSQRHGSRHEGSRVVIREIWANVGRWMCAPLFGWTQATRRSLNTTRPGDTR